MITENSKITKDMALYACWKILDADGNEYHEIKIGSQWWMMENLKTTKFNDSTTISQVTDNTEWNKLTTPAYCYYNNLTSNKDKYGVLYNWYTVSSKKLAPAGWHVPNDAEWDVLQNYLIANGYNYDGTTTDNKIAKSMAAKTDWNLEIYDGAIGKNLTNNNKSGFSALPSGYRYINGSFAGQNGYCGWWSTTEVIAPNVRVRSLYYDYCDLRKRYDVEACGYSVRLVRD